MHLATKQHIVGMLSMIRTACSSIEAALSSDSYYQKPGHQKPGSPEIDPETTLTEEQEDLLGKMLGLEPEPSEQEVSKKPQGKRVNEQKQRLAKDQDVQ